MLRALLVFVLCASSVALDSGLKAPVHIQKQAEVIQSLETHVILNPGDIERSSVPFPSAKRPLHSLSPLAAVHAAAAPSHEEKLHPSYTRITFTAFGRVFDLSLHKNHLIIPPNYVETRIDGSTGKVVSTKTRADIMNCYYLGSVQSFSRADALNSVAVETCSGLRGVIHAYGASYWIEPLESESVSLSARAARTVESSSHLFYRLADLPRDDNVYTCGVHNHPMNFNWLYTRESDSDGKSQPPQDPTHHHDHSHSHDDHQHSFESFQVGSSWGSGSSAPTLMTSNFYYPEILIVNDAERYTYWGFDTERQSGILFNLAAGYYLNSAGNLPDSIALILVQQVTILTAKDPWPVVLDTSGQVNPTLLLGNFTNYQDTVTLQTGTNRHDDALLLSGTTFTQPVIGLAWIGGVCFPTESAGIIQANHYGNNPFDAATLAHELGHNLGMCHDPPGTRDTADGICATITVSNPTTTCANSIMETAADLAAPASTFSACSGQDWTHNLQVNNPTCMTYPNPLRNWFNTSTCGNGFIDVGETCDCYSYSNCSAAPSPWFDPCCNATSCQLYAGNDCPGNFPCCQYKNGKCSLVSASSNTVCRAGSSSACTDDAICTGSSANCPSNPSGSCSSSGALGSAESFIAKNWMWFLIGGGCLALIVIVIGIVRRCNRNPKAEKAARKAALQARAQEKHDVKMAKLASLQDQQQPHSPHRASQQQSASQHQHRPSQQQSVSQQQHRPSQQQWIQPHPPSQHSPRQLDQPYSPPVHADHLAPPPYQPYDASAAAAAAAVAGLSPRSSVSQAPLIAPAPAPVHAPAPAPAPTVLQLPPGWTMVMIDGQHPIYINEQTGEQYDFRTMVSASAPPQ